MAKLIFSFLLFISLTSGGQTVLTMSDARKIEYDINQKKEKIYQFAVPASSAYTDSSYVFKGKETEFINAWNLFVDKFTETLKKSEFPSYKRTKINLVCYFNSDGTVENIIYDITGANNEQNEKFKQIILGLPEKLKINFTSGVKFMHRGFFHYEKN